RVALATPGYPPYRNILRTLGVEALYPPYLIILRTLGVEVVELHVGPEDNWQPTALFLEEAHPPLDSETRLVNARVTGHADAKAN
ncbi:hypothetical protein T484DRAFT_1872193, partial [Baffinella frigidus]